MILISDGDDVRAMNQLLNLQPPANVALIVTSNESLDSCLLSETVSCLKTVSLVDVIDPNVTVNFTHYFSELDKKFPSELVSKTVTVLAISSPLGIAVDDVVLFLKGLVISEDLEQLASLIAYLSILTNLFL